MNFFHDLGQIIYYGNANDIFLRNTIILRPQKLVDIFNLVLNATTQNYSSYLESKRTSNNLDRMNSYNSLNSSNRSSKNPLFSNSLNNLDNQQWKDLWMDFDQKGILDERLLNFLLKRVLDQKPGLLGLMKKFDLICEKRVVGIKVNI